MIVIIAVCLPKERTGYTGYRPRAKGYRKVPHACLSTKRCDCVELAVGFVAIDVNLIYHERSHCFRYRSGFAGAVEVFDVAAAAAAPTCRWNTHWCCLCRARPMFIFICPPLFKRRTTPHSQRTLGMAAAAAARRR